MAKIQAEEHVIVQKDGISIPASIKDMVPRTNVTVAQFYINLDYKVAPEGTQANGMAQTKAAAAAGMKLKKGETAFITQVSETDAKDIPDSVVEGLSGKPAGDTDDDAGQSSGKDETTDTDPEGDLQLTKDIKKQKDAVTFLESVPKDQRAKHTDGETREKVLELLK